MSTFSKLRVILFDIGGVLLELNDVIETFGVKFDETEFHRRWLLSPSVRDFERGKSTAEEFARAITGEFELPYGPAEFIERFCSWPGALFPHAIELVRRVDPRLSCGILSNTNALHWHTFGINETLDGRIDRTFLSFETGLLKPDIDAFTHVIEQYGCKASDILYFDDNPLNVTAARSLGVHAVLCNDKATLSGTLEEARVLT